MTEATTDTTVTTEPTLRETTEQFVLENNMEAIIEKLIWQAQRLKDLDRDKDQILTRLQEQRETSRSNRETVRAKFVEMLDGDKNATIEMDLNDINELLQDIGASKIVFTWTVDVKVTATITGIEADDEQEARDKALRAMELRVDTNALGDMAEIDNEEYDTEEATEEDGN
jgi:hypothetical protein